MRNGEIISKVRHKLTTIETTLLVVSLALALVEFGYASSELDRATEFVESEVE